MRTQNIHIKLHIHIKFNTSIDPHDPRYITVRQHGTRGSTALHLLAFHET